MNMDHLDRALRMALGIVMLCSFFILDGSWKWIGLAGIVPLATGLAGWCPFYAWLAQD